MLDFNYNSIIHKNHAKNEKSHSEERLFFVKGFQGFLPFFDFDAVAHLCHFDFQRIHHLKGDTIDFHAIMLVFAVLTTLVNLNGVVPSAVSTNVATGVVVTTG